MFSWPTALACIPIKTSGCSYKYEKQRILFFLLLLLFVTFNIGGVVKYENISVCRDCNNSEIVQRTITASVITDVVLLHLFTHMNVSFCWFCQ